MIAIKHLQAFIVVIEEKSFTRAAERLYLTQPALSRQIKTLEDYLGAELLERGDKEIVPTDAGQIFILEARKIITSFEEARESIKRLKGVLEGKLVIGASTLPGEYILPELLAGFQNKYPGIKGELHIAGTNQVIEMIRNRTVQLGFVGALPRERELTVEPFLEDELVLLAPASWPTKKECQYYLEKMIMREKGSGTRRIVEEHLQEQGYNLDCRNRIELGSSRAIISAVAAGWGVSYVSRWSVQDALALGKVKVLEKEMPVIKRTIFMALLKDKKLSFAAQAFWDFVQENR